MPIYSLRISVNLHSDTALSVEELAEQQDWLFAEFQDLQNIGEGVWRDLDITHVEATYASEPFRRLTTIRRGR